MRITIHRKALIVVGLMIAVFMVGSITGYALAKAVPQQPQTQVQAQSGSSVYGGWINVYTSYILYLQLQDAGSSRVTVTLTEFVCQSATAYSNGQFTTYTKYLHGLIKGNGIDLEWPTNTLNYSNILMHKDLPTNIHERESYLQKVTRVMFYTDTDRIKDEEVSHDCTFLLRRGVGISYGYQERLSFATHEGTITSIEYPTPKGRSRGGRNKEYPYGKARLHPYTYEGDSKRSLKLVF